MLSKPGVERACHTCQWRVLHRCRRGLGCMVPWLRPAAHGARYSYVLGFPWQAYNYGRPLITKGYPDVSLLGLRRQETPRPPTLMP